jgi:hypothetical protein
MPSLKSRTQKGKRKWIERGRRGRGNEMKDEDKCEKEVKRVWGFAGFYTGGWRSRELKYRHKYGGGVGFPTEFRYA